MLNFQNVNAAAVAAGLSITGSTGANSINGAAGASTIDGYGGLDTIVAGAGNDVVTFHGTETSINGGGGLNTLILSASGATTAINLAVSAGTDQTTGDTVAVTNFQSVNAGALSTALTLTGSTGANTIIGSAGASTIDGNGGTDSITAGAGADTIYYHGSETYLNGGGGTNTLLLATGVSLNLAAANQAASGGATILNFQNVNAAAVATGVSIIGSAGANSIIGAAGASTIDGYGGSDTIVAGAGDDTISYHGAEASINAGGGANLLILVASGGTTAINLAVSAGVDQTTGDAAAITNFQSVNASALSGALTITG